MRGKIQVFGIILAAGKSERFKKSFLKIKNGIKDFKISSKVDTDLDKNRNRFATTKMLYRSSRKKNNRIFN